MNPGADKLQALLAKLRPWQAYMERSTRSNVVFTPHPNGEFSVTLLWRTRDGTPGKFTREFTAEFCFGSTHRLTPPAWAHQQKPCDHARALVREVLRVRGAL